MGWRWVLRGCLAVCLWVCAPLQAAPIVHVTTDITGMSSIQVGQTATINVRALIENPASANDGIFTFDLDLIMANVIVAQPSILSVQSVTRTGVDDVSFGGSNGTVNPAGISAIYGGYPIDTNGIGSPMALFSVVVKGIAAGSETITPGPSLNPYGFDFTLYSSGAPVGVTYDNGVLLSVTAVNGGGGGGGGGPAGVPVPLAVWMGAVGGVGVMARRR